MLQLHASGVHDFIDTNFSGKLERNEVVEVLTKTDFTTPAGRKPSETEVDFVMKIADRNGDGCIDTKELSNALVCWKKYTEQREQLESALKKYDTSGNGKLEKEELKAYLTELNEGIVPNDEEVDWVMSEADFLGLDGPDGAITVNELIMATMSWYWHEAAAKEAKSFTGRVKSSSCCSIS
jgi:Ca2+-binding EF-hand superfamily protein